MDPQPSWLLPSVLMTAAASSAVAASYFYLWRYLLGRPFIGFWALGWLFSTLNQLSSLAYLTWGENPLFRSLGILFECLAGLAILRGCFDFAQKKSSAGSFLAVAGLSFLWAAFTIFLPDTPLTDSPGLILLGFCLIRGGSVIFEERRMITLPLLLVLYGIDQLDGPFFEVYFPKLVGHTYIVSAPLAFGSALCLFVAALREWVNRHNGELAKRIATEETLRESEARFLELAQITREVVWEIDPEGRYTYVSPGAAGVYGYEPSEMTGKMSFFELHPEESRERFKAGAFELFSKREVFRNVLNQVLAKDGTTRFLSSSGTPIHNSDGSFAGYRGVDLDVTDQHRSRAERDMLLRQLETILESSQAGILSIDRTGRIVFANSRMSELFGYSRDELLSLEYPDLVHADQEGQSRSYMNSIISGEIKQVDTERRYRRKDGTDWWGFISSRRHSDEHGRFMLLIAVISDLTEKRAMEERVRQATKVESIGRLSGGVAHDFNNMLSIINGNAELALARKGGDPDVREHLEEILKAGTRSSNIVRQLLAFARKQDIQPVVLDLNEKISDIKKMLGRLIGEDVALDFTAAEDLWYVKMDPSQVDQLLVNLATNSRDAIGGNGRVTISTFNAVADEEFCRRTGLPVPGEYTVLTFADNGCGMSEEVLANIFEPFFTTKGIGEGTGLGLSTVYGIVRQNHGWLKVDTALGRGTAFTIYLPRCKEPPVERALFPESLKSLSGVGRILVVEDERGLLKFITKSLSKLGYTTFSTDDPVEALRIVEQQDGEFDLVITDVVMPTMNGRELALKLAERHPGLTFLYVSGYTQDMVASRGVIDSSINFLPKPFTIEELASKVGELTAR